VILSKFQKNLTVLLDNLVYIYRFSINNNITKVIYSAPESVVKMYNKTLGQQECINPHIQYGKIATPLKLMSWNILDDTSDRFKKKVNRRSR
jgi:hypothetical protein